MKSRPEPKQNSYFLFTTPRSGSTPVCDYLGSALQKKHNTENLFEFFNLKFGVPETQERRLVRFKKFGYPQDWLSTEEKQEQEKVQLERLKEIPTDDFRLLVQDRFQLLASNQKKYFFKLFPQTLPIPQVEWLSQQSQIVFLERRNKFEQLLSWLISKETQAWYSSEGFYHQNSSVLAQEKSIDDCLYAFELFDKFKALHPEAPLIYFEDFMQDKTLGLKAIGCADMDMSDFKFMFPKQNLNKTEAVLSNLNFVKEKYRQSLLQKQFPIK